MILSLTHQRKILNPYHLFTEPLTLTTLNFFFILSLKNIYQNHGGLENVFTTNQGDEWIFETITKFKRFFFLLVT